jgi:hypothetical protein
MPRVVLLPFIPSSLSLTMFVKKEAMLAVSEVSGRARVYPNVSFKWKVHPLTGLPCDVMHSVIHSFIHYFEGSS